MPGFDWRLLWRLENAGHCETGVCRLLWRDWIMQAAVRPLCDWRLQTAVGRLDNAGRCEAVVRLETAVVKLEATDCCGETGDWTEQVLRSG